MELFIIPVESDRIFRLTGQRDDVNLIDYDLFGLHKVRRFLKGELIEVNYYKHFSEQTGKHSWLCVSERNVYIRRNDFVYKRDKQIIWYLENGEIGLEKNTVKYYSELEAIAEGKTRRENIIDGVKTKAWNLLGPANAFGLLTLLKPQIDIYLEGYLEPLYQALAGVSQPYLDNFLLEDNQTTVRAFLIDFVTI